MKRKYLCRVVSLILALCMMITMIPVSVPASSVETNDSIESILTEEMELETNKALWFQQITGVLQENGSAMAIVLRRSGDLSEAEDATVVLYDNNANYGEDYVIKYGDETVSGQEGAKSIFDAFRDDGMLLPGSQLQGSLNATAEQSDKTVEESEVTTADFLSQLDDLCGMAASVKVHFPAGVDAVVLIAQPLNDSLSEYDESFYIAVLDCDGVAVNGSQLILNIIDDEPKPQLDIAIDIPLMQNKLSVDVTTGLAELNFIRTGDLATDTSAVLLKNGKMYGYVQFSAWQSRQVVLVEPGVYTMASKGNYTVDGRTIIVTGNTTAAVPGINALSGSEMIVTDEQPDEPDSVLDDVPDEYAGMPDMRDGDPWLPGWMNYANGHLNGLDKYVVEGSTSAFHVDYNTSKNGQVKLNVDGRPVHMLSTSGTFSGTSKSEQRISYDKTVNLTGVDYFWSEANVTGVDDNAEIVMSLLCGDQTWKHAQTITGDGNYKFKVEVDQGLHATGTLSYENRDIKNTARGVNLYVPNGYVVHYRQYRVRILPPDTLNYGAASGAPEVTDTTQVVDMGGYQGSNVIQINYSENDKDFPASLKGFYITDENGIELTDLITNTTGQISFDTEFLWRYEEHALNTKDSAGTVMPTFYIKPAFEKRKVESTIKTSAVGVLTREDGGGDVMYMGDRLVFSGSNTDGAALYGVRVEAQTGVDSSIKSWIVEADDGKVYMTLDTKYSIYSFQGLFRADTNVLHVYYDESKEENRHGQLVCDEGLLVKEDEYIKGNYVTLSAKPDNDYVTCWKTNQQEINGTLVYNDVYYGDVFYYQLNGNPDFNTVVVEFIPKSELKMATATISGYLNVRDVELATLRSTLIPLDSAMYNITGTKNYSGNTTSAEGTKGAGYFKLEDFEYVEGGTYSIMASYKGSFGYVYIKMDGSKLYNINFPQFPGDNFHPDAVTVKLNGNTSEDTSVSLKSGSVVSVDVEVFQQQTTNFKINEVNLIFRPIMDDGTYGLPVATLPANLNSEATDALAHDFKAIYSLDVDAAKLTANTRMFIEVKYSQQNVTGDGSKVWVECSSGEVDSGYSFTPPVADETLLVQQPIEPIYGAQNSLGINVSDLEIPYIGFLDFGVTSKTGGFYVRDADPNDPSIAYLICGYSITSQLFQGTVQDKWDGAAKTYDKLKDAQNKGEPQKGGSEDLEQDLVTNPDENKKNEQAGEKKNKQEQPRKFYFSPVFMFKITTKTLQVTETKEDGTTSTSTKDYVVGYEVALGFDGLYTRNFPFTIYGFPMYVTVTMQTQTYGNFKAQHSYNIDVNGNYENVAEGSTLYDALTGKVITDSEATAGKKTDYQGLIASPLTQLGIRTGAGFSGYAGVYVESSIGVAYVLQVYPEADIAMMVLGSVTLGADLLLFNASAKVSLPKAAFGSDDELMKDLTELEVLNKGTARTSSRSSAGADAGTEYESTEEAVENLTFALMERPDTTNLFHTERINSRTLTENVFKNTKIQLYKLADDRIIAFYLADNHAEDGSLNYLSAAYSVSNDNGATWSQAQYISNNAGNNVTSLQYDVSLFEFDDYLLVTWSEADFDALLADVDLSNGVTAAQIATLMNAMNLRGRLFDIETAEPVGDAFTIAENSTVACGALDAVEHNGVIYVYYQRNAYDIHEDMTLEDILTNDKTIARASANTADCLTGTSMWSSMPVRVMTEDGHQYRITEVEPFVHDGVLGEILVLDRDGRLAVYNQTTGQWDASSEDRQLYLRTYTFDEEGVPQTNGLMAITQANVCAQSPQVVSNDDYLHLFWNEDGQIVYLTDFIATWKDHVDVQAGAYYVLQEDGSITKVSHLNDEIARGSSVAEDSSFTMGTTFSASMTDDGHVLLSWIGNDESNKEALIPKDEVYGIILHTVTNAQNTEGGNENVYELNAVGQPVALTNEDSYIGALDSLCISNDLEDKFLLAFTCHTGELRSDIKQTDILVTNGIDAPVVSIESVEANDYPMPGSTMYVDVTISNEGLEPLSGYTITADGLGETVTFSTTESLMPGSRELVQLEVLVPENFNASQKLTIRISGVGEQEKYSASQSIDVLYGSYFVPVEIPIMESIANTNNYVITTLVENRGNAAGKPTLTLDNSIYGSDQAEDHKKYTYTYDQEVSSGSMVKVEYLMEDAICTGSLLANLAVSLGDGYDQSVNGMLPTQRVRTIDAFDKDTGDEPGDMPDSTDPGNPPATGDINIIMLLSMMGAALLSLSAFVVLRCRKYKEQ